MLPLVFEKTSRRTVEHPLADAAAAALALCPCRELQLPRTALEIER